MSGDHAPRALDSIRVLDLAWVFSGPMAAHVLADLGAEVIKVEHRARMDNARHRGTPYRDGQPIEGPYGEISPYFHQNNRNKLSVTLDMKHPDGAELIRRIADTSDVVVENLRPGVLERAGLGYDVLSARNPRLTMMSMSMAGQEGPLRGIRGYAPIMSALSGLESVVGYGDGTITGMMSCLVGDANAATHAAMYVLAALIERERTGRGQYIDLSQTEALLTTLAEPVASLQLAARDPALRGTRHPLYAPHGNYPCRASDSWVAIGVQTDEEWDALVGVLDEDVLRDERLATAAGRQAHADELDEVLAVATRRHDRDELADRLRAAGVAAAPVASAVTDVRAEPHLHSRGLFPEVDHPASGPERLACVPWRMSLTPPCVDRPAPLLGQHTHEVLSRVLGLDEEEIRRLEESGAAQ